MARSLLLELADLIVREPELCDGPLIGGVQPKRVAVFVDRVAKVLARRVRRGRYGVRPGLRETWSIRRSSRKKVHLRSHE